jgi:hypothetical protein
LGVGRVEAESVSCLHINSIHYVTMIVNIYFRERGSGGSSTAAKAA